MCGIAGKIDTKGNNISGNDIKLMLAKINHRGPDDEGFFIDKNVALGHKRLSIIDLSPKGHQPMTSSDNKLTIVFNGEIYNYKELKKDLKKKGVKFVSQTDTEVLLYLYQHYGTKCLDRLRGMFAFVIYDKSKNIIFGARDRLGIKPLKYYHDDKIFIFSSEAKAILENHEVTKEIDNQAVYDYLTFSYVPQPRTGFKNIFKLPQASYFILNLNNNNFKIKRYWDINYNNKTTLSRKEVKSRLLELVEESIKLRMISDVPLGVFLSGGLDSSLVTHYMAVNSSQPIRSYSIRSDVSKYDEGKYIDIIVDKYKTDHHELFIKPDSFEDLDKLIYDYEEPFGDSSMLPLYKLSQYASKDITVSLCGEGGDEAFGGYSYYIKQNYFNTIKRYPRLLRKLRSNITNYYWHNIRNNNFINLDDKFLSELDINDVELYSSARSYLNEIQKYSMLKSEWLVSNNIQSSTRVYNEIIRNKIFNNQMDKIMYLDYYSFVPDDLMTKLDIASMANGLEGRVPLLDHKLVEFCASMRTNQKLKGFNTKTILKESLEGILPSSIIHRSKKGFGMPVNEWFRGELKDYAQDHILNSSGLIHQIFNQDKLEKYFQKHMNKKANLGNGFWNLLTLELWYKNYFK